MSRRQPEPRRWVAPSSALRLGALLLVVAAATMLAFSAPSAPANRGPEKTLHIDLNSASIEELRLLPGIGPALADRIAADREARGPFSSLDELTRVRGVGERTVLNLRSFAFCSPDDE